MRREFRIPTCLLAAALALGWAGVTAAATAEKELLIYKGQPAALAYRLEVKTHHKVFDHRGGGYRKKTPERSHHDIIGFNLAVSEKPDGKVDQKLTFTSINGKSAKLWGRQGDVPVIWLNREQIVGNNQKLEMDLLGRVVAATGAPHFMSPSYRPKRSPDGPALDMYRILTMIFPQFPLRRVAVGETWRVKDKYTVGPAPEKDDAAIWKRPHKLDAKIRRNLRLTLKGFEQKGGYRVARIAVKGRFSADIKGIEPNNGHYVTTAGDVSGEFLFAPEKGLLVEATFKNKYHYSYAKDGVLVSIFLTPKERVSLLLEDDTTPPVPWRGNQSVHLELKSQTAAVSPAVTTASR